MLRGAFSPAGGKRIFASLFEANAFFGGDLGAPAKGNLTRKLALKPLRKVDLLPNAKTVENPCGFSVKTFVFAPSGCNRDVFCSAPDDPYKKRRL